MRVGTKTCPSCSFNLAPDRTDGSAAVDNEFADFLIYPNRAVAALVDSRNAEPPVVGVRRVCGSCDFDIIFAE